MIAAPCGVELADRIRVRGLFGVRALLIIRCKRRASLQRGAVHGVIGASDIRRQQNDFFGGRVNIRHGPEFNRIGARNPLFPASAG